MDRNQIVKLRRVALSNLKLPSMTVTEDLVNSFRAYLLSTDNTDDVVQRCKPKKRLSIARDFLYSNHSSGLSIKRYYWPTRQSTLTESAIIQELADLMCLNAGKVPRQTPRVGQPSSSATEPEAIDAHAISQPNSQQDSRGLALAAAAKRAMDKLDRQDPTYSEVASDFVQDTSRETRNLHKNSSTSPQIQLPSPSNMAKGSSSFEGLTPVLQAHSNMARRVAEAKRVRTRSSSASHQFRTPPPSRQWHGKQPATDTFDISDDEISHSGLLLETDGPQSHSPYFQPLRKRPKLDAGPVNMETLEKVTTAPAGLGPRTPAGNSFQLAQSVLDQSLDDGEPSVEDADLHGWATNRNDSPVAPASPSRVRIEPLYPSSLASTADVAVQCRISDSGPEPGDRIVIDLRELQFAQLYDLPLIFLGHLGNSRRSHEIIGTNESRARAAVLRDVEESFQKMLRCTGRGGA